MGKTTLKKRLIGSTSDNEKAFYDVQQNKKEKMMTHGVEIDKWEYKKNGKDIHFSMWDFAGHEE